MTNLSHARLTGVEEVAGEEDMVVEGCSTLARAAVVLVRKSDREGLQSEGQHLTLIDQEMADRAWNYD